MKSIQLLLADDDNDDCMLFQEALSELSYNVNLSIVNDGEQLMSFLNEHHNFTGILFLDLNMPRKNGIECLTEIKLNEHLKQLPIIIISTSYDKEIVKGLFDNGANYYIRKPNNFEKLKVDIQQAISFFQEKSLHQINFDSFTL